MDEKPDRFEITLVNRREAGVTFERTTRPPPTEMKRTFWAPVIDKRTGIDTTPGTRPVSANQIEAEWRAKFPAALKKRFVAARYEQAGVSPPAPVSEVPAFSFRVGNTHYGSLTFTLLIEGARQLYAFCDENPDVVRYLLDLCIPGATGDAVGADPDTFAVGEPVAAASGAAVAAHLDKGMSVIREVGRRAGSITLLLPVVLMLVVGFMFLDYLKGVEPERSESWDQISADRIKGWDRIAVREKQLDDQIKATTDTWSTLAGQQRALIDLLTKHLQDRANRPPATDPPRRPPLRHHLGGDVTVSVSNVNERAPVAAPTSGPR